MVFTVELFSYDTNARRRQIWTLDIPCWTLDIFHPSDSPTMIHRFHTLVFWVLFTMIAFNLNGQGFSVVVDSVQAQPGQTVCVPVRAKGFVEIVSFQYTLTWNQQVLTYTDVQNLNLPGWSEDLDFGLLLPDHLYVGWAHPLTDCYTTSDGDVLFEVCFVAIGPLGSGSPISAGSTGFPPGNGGAEAYNCLFQDVWSTSGNVPGYVDITNTSSTFDVLQTSINPFQLNPNPTQTSTQLTYQSTSSAKAVLLVTNSLGQLVFQQNVSIQIGENQFEIPANALNVKGMYQVSLKTEQGLSSQMLSVH
jgi:hypothetical protein